MGKKTLVTALLALVFCSAVPSQGISQTTVIRAETDSVANGVLRTTGVPSATVSVVRNNQVILTNAYGSAKLDPLTVATPNMRYAVGSISKQFTAVAALILQQEGKLRVDDPISRYVPGLTRGNDVTIRMLLSHTSGYQDFWPQDYVMPGMLKATTPQAIADAWAKKPLDFEPGSRWQYSNTNYTLAGMAVEKAAGIPIWQFVKTRARRKSSNGTPATFSAIIPAIT